MRKINVIGAIALAAQVLMLPSVATAFNRDVCKSKLLELLEAAPTEANFTVEKRVVGVITKSNMEYKLAEGQPCDMKITVYQVGGPGALVYVLDSNYQLNPFNHSVTTTPEACDGSETNSVSGEYAFRQDSGWRHRFSTEFELTKNNDGTYKLRYAQERSRVTCVGTLQEVEKK